MLGHGDSSARLCLPIRNNPRPLGFFPDLHATVVPRHREVVIIGNEYIADIAQEIDKQRDFRMRATIFPEVTRTSSFVSSTLTAGGSGVSITAHEKSLGNVPVGATRTRKFHREILLRALLPYLPSIPHRQKASRLLHAANCCRLSEQHGSKAESREAF